MPVLIVGFDWARNKHGVCVRSPSGETFFEEAVKHDAQALEQLRVRLGELEPDPAARQTIPAAFLASGFSAP